MSNNYAFDSNYPAYGFNGASGGGGAAAPHPAHPHLGPAAAAALGSGAEASRVPEIQAPAGEGGGELGDASMQVVNAAASEAAAAAAAASHAAVEAVNAAGSLEETEAQHSPSSGKAASSLAPPSGSAKKEAPYSRSPELRESHKMAERKRRKEMKDLFDDLRNVLPEEKGPKTSKWEILRQAVGHFNHLKECNAAYQGEIELLRAEVVRLGGTLPDPAHLPAPPAPLSSRDSAGAEAPEQQAHYEAMEHHHAHAHEQTHEEAHAAAELAAQQQHLEEQQQHEAAQQEMSTEDQAAVAAAAAAAQHEANYFAAAAANGHAETEGEVEGGAGAQADAEGEMEAEGEAQVAQEVDMANAEGQVPQEELQAHHDAQLAAHAGETTEDQQAAQQGQDVAMATETTY